MMYQAWKRPGRNPSTEGLGQIMDSDEMCDRVDLLQSAMFMRLSAEQIPLFTQTASGGKRMAMRPRKMSLPHILGVGYEVACSVFVVWSWLCEAHNKKAFEGHEMMRIMWMP